MIFELWSDFAPPKVIEAESKEDNMAFERHNEENVRLVDAQHPPKKSFDDQWIINLRTKIYSACVFSNSGTEIGRAIVMV